MSSANGWKCWVAVLCIQMYFVLQALIQKKIKAMLSVWVWSVLQCCVMALMTCVCSTRTMCVSYASLLKTFIESSPNLSFKKRETPRKDRGSPPFEKGGVRGGF